MLLEFALMVEPNDAIADDADDATEAVDDVSTIISILSCYIIIHGSLLLYNERMK